MLLCIVSFDGLLALPTAPSISLDAVSDILELSYLKMGPEVA